MESKIVEFYKDENQEWVAKLDCGHTQHMRHKPPFINRPWTKTKDGRKNYIGHKIDCKKCDNNHS